MEDVLSEFNISPNQIYTCTTDNGANMLKCIEELAANENDQNLCEEKENEEFEEDDTDGRDDDDCDPDLERMDEISFNDIAISKKCIGKIINLQLLILETILTKVLI